MVSAFALRSQIEAALADRIPSALTPQPRMIRPVVPTGVAAVDEVVGGGLPVGALTEMVGRECSGRTSLALGFVAQIMREGKVCAWVDVSDALSPESAAAAGVDLARLLWIRCGVVPEADEKHVSGAKAPIQSGPGNAGTEVPAYPIPSSAGWGELPQRYFVAPPPKKGLHGGGFGMHPREEEKGLGEAVSGLFEPRCAEPQRREPAGRCAVEARAVTSAAKAVLIAAGSYGTAEAVPLSNAVELRGDANSGVVNEAGAQVGAGTNEQHVAGAKAPGGGVDVGAGTEVPAYQISGQGTGAEPGAGFSATKPSAEGPRLKPGSFVPVIPPAKAGGSLRCGGSRIDGSGERRWGAKRKPWSRMDQALRAMDLLLQAGGFGAVVLDMGSVAPEHVSRIPLATWFRYRAAAERTQACVVLLSQYACAKSSADLVMRLEPGKVRVQGGTVLTGFERRVEVARRRFEEQKVVPMRKPPQRAGVGLWQSRATWAGQR